MKQPKSIENIAEQDQCTREEVYRYIESWKNALEVRKDLYGKYFSGSTGGIVTVIISIGLSFEQIQQFGLFEKLLITATLILLVLATGNILNCTSFVTTASLDLFRLERFLIAKDYEYLPREEIISLDGELNSNLQKAHQYFPNAYWCVMIAGFLGIVGFLTILYRA